ncbi:MAG: hypothetical protein H6985_04665 [Pseudomonadales bacterium]|nr:hypothetical protein [Halioglobus sp.]MCP5128862.1 hypothetical protein [Pseudomonadales bacterium]
MSLERWGSLSVCDHIDSNTLVANVLLYDRLVFPVFTEAEDRDEHEYWRDHGWDPDLQEKRIAQLDDLAVRKPWNKQRRDLFSDRLSELKNLQEDVNELDALHLTRRILAQEQAPVLAPGRPHPEIIAAYNSETGIHHDFSLEQGSSHKALQAYLVARRLAIPDIADTEAALGLAIDLSRDDDFRERRRDLFDWQDRTIEQGYTPGQAVEYMTQLTDKYNEAVVQAHKQVYYRFAFLIGGLALGIAGAGLGQPIAGASAILALVQFGTLDKKPVVEAGKARPMAAFHDIDLRMGLKFSGN